MHGTDSVQLNAIRREFAPGAHLVHFYMFLKRFTPAPDTTTLMVKADNLFIYDTFLNCPLRPSDSYMRQ